MGNRCSFTLHFFKQSCIKSGHTETVFKEIMAIVRLKPDSNPMDLTVNMDGKSTPNL